MTPCFSISFRSICYLNDTYSIIISCFRALLSHLADRQQSTGLLFLFSKSKINRDMELENEKKRLKDIGIIFPQPASMTPSQKVRY